MLERARQAIWKPGGPTQFGNISRVIEDMKLGDIQLHFPLSQESKQ